MPKEAFNLGETPVGVYGKLPTLGDFISRRLPGDFVHCWDEWIQNAMNISRKNLGESWLDIYLVSPVWRFILDSGVCGQNAWAGILIPSVDKVGRYFPLTLATSIPKKFAVPGLFIRGASWFDWVETIALSALRDDFDPSQFDRKPEMSISRKSLSWIGVPEGTDGNFRISDAVFHIEIPSQAETLCAWIELSNCLIDKYMSGYSIWHTKGSEQTRQCLMIYEGMPLAETYVGFLKGFCG